MMENDRFNIPGDMVFQNSVSIEGILPPSAQDSLVQSDSFDLNDQNHYTDRISMIVQRQSVNNFHADFHSTNPVNIDDCNSLVSLLGRNVVRDDSLVTSCPMANTEFQEQLAGGTPISAASLAFLAAKIGLQENLEKSEVLSAPVYPLELLGTYMSNSCPNASNSLSATSGGCGYEEVLDRCSGVSCSDVTLRCLDGTRSSLEQTSSDSREVSIRFGSNRHEFSQVILGSRYLQGIQEILAQVANYSLENMEDINLSTAGIRIGGNTLNTSFLAKKRTLATSPSADTTFEVQTESTLQRRAVEARKNQLLTLLQLVDDHYNQCLNEVHTVVSAFHAAAELDPRIHAHFALHTVSYLYKDLRERISNYILATGANLTNSCLEEKERCIDTSFIQKQWALQQLKRKDHQLWRPQRGLPERSVSVLRAWMFQNFLHPYPKDAEKHLLAVKSGLTRSQVSNWFINARVRLWKPMIEEMYAEMNRRKSL
ncbi:BEL1-like homeodomain protein [Quillaja saponaria]|uniref:BEL1-like homeodomain protein n=1 Tax=Quillaja saponaria TaxID=32244 RepID=A0AAD7LI31_QUISA|nr:BEL1-like homeodomain protein [Quillaja saponaria]